MRVSKLVQYDFGQKFFEKRRIFIQFWAHKGYFLVEWFFLHKDEFFLELICWQTNFQKKFWPIKIMFFGFLKGLKLSPADGSVLKLKLILVAFQGCITHVLKKNFCGFKIELKKCISFQNSKNLLPKKNRQKTLIS